MRLNFDNSILEQMSEGVILLNRQAHVLSSNKAAEFWLQPCRTMAPVIKRLIDEEVAGRVNFPIAVDKLVGAQAVGTSPVKVWLCKNGKRDYAIFMAPPKLAVVTQSNHDTTDKRYVALLGDQIRQEISAYRGLLAKPLKTPVDREVLTQSQHISHLLEEISNLALLMQRDQVFASERIDLHVLLPHLLAQESESHAGNYRFKPGSQPQGVLYGDTAWLTYALQVLVQALWRGAPPQSHIEVTTRQLGDFIIVTGHTGYGRVTPDGTLHGAAQAPVAVSRDAATCMLMCQRIVELHSGFLKIKWMSGNDNQACALGQGMESFVLTLLSGLPDHERSRASCTECRINLQAQAYAQDIAQLMANATSQPT